MTKLENLALTHQCDLPSDDDPEMVEQESSTGLLSDDSGPRTEVFVNAPRRQKTRTPRSTTKPRRKKRKLNFGDDFGPDELGYRPDDSTSDSTSDNTSDDIVCYDGSDSATDDGSPLIVQF